MRNALSIAAGAWLLTSVPKKLLIRSAKLMRPSAIVTGSISFSTRVTCGLRQSSVKVKLPPRPRSQGIGRRSWTKVAINTPQA
jgi:hypothetical protein